MEAEFLGEIVLAAIAEEHRPKPRSEDIPEAHAVLS
jgi:hypothetical protein